MNIRIEPIPTLGKNVVSVNLGWGLNPVGAEIYDQITEFILESGDCADRKTTKIVKEEYRNAEDQIQYLLDQIHAQHGIEIVKATIELFP